MKEKEIPSADDYDYGINDPEYAKQLALEKADGIGRLFRLKMHAIISTWNDLKDMVFNNQFTVAKAYKRISNGFDEFQQ